MLEDLKKAGKNYFKNFNNDMEALEQKQQMNSIKNNYFINKHNLNFQQKIENTFSLVQ